MIKTNDFRLNNQELKTAYYGIQNFNRNKFQPWLLWASVLYLLLMISGLFFLVHSGINNSRALILLLRIAAPFLIFYGFGYLVSALLFHLIFKKEPLYQCSSFVEINDDFISQTYEDGSFFKFHLNFIKAVLKKEDVYVFIIENNMVFIFPGRALNSEEDVQILDNHLKKKN